MNIKSMLRWQQIDALLALLARKDREWLARERWVALQPPYLPGLSLARSLASTGGGTSLETSPPNLHTSLQRFDET